VNRSRRGFTMVEMLVVITIVAVLTSMLLPSLSEGKRQARALLCRNHLKQLGQAVVLYCEEYNGYMMPLAYQDDWPVCYWWGTSARPMNYQKGFIYPFIDTTSKPESVFECPEQPLGTYVPQGPGKQPTSTYGYNGYYLCPPATPGWCYTIGFRPWRRLDDITRADQVFMFADTLIDWGGCAGNNCLLDPPRIFNGAGWDKNEAPTTCFRHNGRANACFLDGHVEAVEPQGGEITSAAYHIGSCGPDNAFYVPDWEEWTASQALGSDASR
jgi:prepilin-type N-terminal cleavage/methylation domain-containing protein/prepilin-type processing-associated H-X9-DG protein